jgi:hypothetical protein
MIPRPVSPVFLVTEKKNVKNLARRWASLWSLFEDPGTDAARDTCHSSERILLRRKTYITYPDQVRFVGATHAYSPFSFFIFALLEVRIYRSSVLS